MIFIGFKKSEWENVYRCPVCGKPMQNTVCRSYIPIDREFIHAFYTMCPKCGYVQPENKNNPEWPPVDFTKYPKVKELKIGKVSTDIDLDVIRRYVKK